MILNLLNISYSLFKNRKGMMMNAGPMMMGAIVGIIIGAIVMYYVIMNGYLGCPCMPVE